MMTHYSALRNAFHLVQGRTLWSSARKPFWPASHGGQQIHVSRFQNLLKEQRNKILVSIRLVNDPANGIAGLTYLGQNLLSRINIHREIANYLYMTGIIHPKFFAEALHVIASNSKALAPHTQRIRLGMLGRDNLKKALDRGAVSTLELGKNFKRFAALIPAEKLSVLQRLGVIQLKSESTLDDILALRQAPRQSDPQLNLF